MNICPEHNLPDIMCWPHKPKPTPRKLTRGLYALHKALLDVQERSKATPTHWYMSYETFKYLLDPTFAWKEGFAQLYGLPIQRYPDFEWGKVALVERQGIFDDPLAVVWL